MSMQRNTSVPTGEILGTYRSREEAQATISYLGQQGFNVRALSIVGSDVKIVETVMGIMSWAQAAGRGALTGAWLGLLFGLLMSFFSGQESLSSGALLPGIIIGIGLGMLWGIVTRALVGRKNNVIARPQVVANEFQIVCDPALANEARALLSRR